MTDAELDTPPPARPCPADIAAIVADRKLMPPLTPAQRSRISLLLRPQAPRPSVVHRDAERSAS